VEVQEAARIDLASVQGDRGDEEAGWLRRPAAVVRPREDPKMPFISVAIPMARKVSGKTRLSLRNAFLGRPTVSLSAVTGVAGA
jgi:hypothetical protein